MKTAEQEAKIQELINEMSLEEKVRMIHGAGLFRTDGVERLGIPPLYMSDGPMGVRADFEDNNWRAIDQSYDYVTYLPSNAALASTWNPNLAYEEGKVLGCEARGRGKDVILAPGINIQRSPLCGRNFEYMSEDPKLIEEMAVPFIHGVQENDVAACVKHFAGNNQETERLGVDTYIEERALRELYLPGFHAAIRQGNSYSIMGAYNRLRGELCCESKFLLNDILRKEWQYDGTVISDWSGVCTTEGAAEAELDIEMAVTYNFDEYYLANPLIAAVKNGKIKEELINKKVKNILRLMYRLKMLGEEKVTRKAGAYNTLAHHNSVLNIARESIVLLKNEENRLPLKKDNSKKIAIIGQNAEMIHSNGGGSAEIKALYEISPLMGIKKLLGGNVKVEYAKGYYIPSKEEKSDLNWQATSVEREKEKELTEEELREFQKKEMAAEEEIKKQGNVLLDEAISLAKSADEVIFIGGLNHDYDSEGLDRKDMMLPYGQDEVIQAILEVNKNAVIVMIAGSPVSYQAFADEAKAIVWSSYNGMEGGTALAEVLFGDVNPSGKLPVTFPKSLSDSPAHVYGEFACGRTVTYKEGLMVGYRYFDTKEVEPEYCFGHGLSYTKFEYDNMSVSVKDDETNITVSLTVKNVGKVYGGEIIQLYVKDKDSSVARPIHELKGFAKVFLAPGEKKEVTIDLGKEAFAFYSEEDQGFKIEAGEFVIEVGASSRDIRVTKSIEIKQDYLL